MIAVTAKEKINQKNHVDFANAFGSFPEFLARGPSLAFSRCDSLTKSHVE